MTDPDPMPVPTGPGNPGRAVMSSPYRLTATVDGKPVAQAVATAWGWHLALPPLTGVRRNCCYSHWKAEDMREPTARARWVACDTRGEARDVLRGVLAGRPS